MTTKRNKPATSKQRSLLARWGHTNLDGLTIAQASELIDQAKAQMDALVEDAKRKAQGLDLVAMAERRVELRHETPNELAGPCPRCGGDDRFHVTATWFFCRRCHEKRGDALDYLAWVDNRDFIEVCMEVTGEQFPLTTATLPPPVPATILKPTKRRQPPTGADIEKFTRIADDAHAALLNDPDAEAGRQYLLSRGIDQECWERFHLGFRSDVPLPGTWSTERREYTQPRQPAIVLPWVRQGKVQAIRYRFLAMHEYADAHGKPTKAKQTAQPGSYFEDGIYGEQALPPWTWEPAGNSTGHRGENVCTLVICEGELNAISIWRMTNRWNWEVLSLGSESAHIPQSTIDELACHFRRVLVWMDRPERAREEMARLGPLAYGINSLPKKDADGQPLLDDRGKPKQMDANDLLQAGLLGGFLAEVRRRACRTDHERQGFYYDLWDADRHPPYLDSGARQVMNSMVPQKG